MRRRRVFEACMLTLAVCFVSAATEAAFLHLSTDAGSPGAVLMGKVSGPAGESLEGIAVSARGAGETVNTSVYTNEEGLYFFPPLHSGKYRVWSQAVGFEVAQAEVEVDGGKELRLNFALKKAKDFTKQLSAPEWMAALPEDTPADRRMKSIFRNNCSGCHPANFPLQNRFDEDGWRTIISHMDRTNAYGERPRPDRPPYSPILTYFTDELAAYLARMRGPGPSPMKFKPFPRPRGEAAMVVVTEYDIPSTETVGLVTHDGSDWSEGVPSVYEARGPHDAVVDPNGIVWIADTDLGRTVTRLDPRTGQVKDFAVRDRRGNVMSSHGIVVNPKGIAWFNAGGGLGRIDTKTEKTDWFESTEGMGRVGGTLDVDTHGVVWASTNLGAIRFDPSTQKFTEFRSLNPHAPTYGVAADSEGNGWWAQLNGDLMGKSDIRTGKSEQVVLDPLPVEIPISEKERKLYELSGTTNNVAPPGRQGPRRLSGDKNRPIVWVADWWGDNIAKIDIRTHKVTYYPIPGASPFQLYGTYDTVVDKDGIVWVALQNADSIGKFDPKTEQWTLYPLPTRGTETRFIDVDNYKDRAEVWVPYWRTNKVARVQFRRKDELQALAQRLTAQRSQ